MIDNPDGAGTEPLIADADLAGRGARLGAYVLDWVIVGAISMVAVFSLGWFNEVAAGDAGAAARTALVALAAYGAVNGYFLAQRGQTVGKMAVGVRVVSGKTGDIVPVWNSFGLRVVFVQLVFQIPIVGMPIALVNALFIFGERRRCLHDFLAGTLVVDANRARPDADDAWP